MDTRDIIIGVLLVILLICVYWYMTINSGYQPPMTIEPGQATNVPPLSKAIMITCKAGPECPVQQPCPAQQPCPVPPPCPEHQPCPLTPEEIRQLQIRKSADGTPFPYLITSNLTPGNSLGVADTGPVYFPHGLKSQCDCVPTQVPSTFSVFGVGK